jgi:hypothetical protein
MNKIYATVTLKVFIYQDSNESTLETINKLSESIETLSFDGDILDSSIEVTDSK